MEILLSFAIMVIAISASGVMSPGPLFAANIVYGLKEGKIAGLKIAMGHTVVEFPLIVFLGLGTISLETFPEYRILITVIGAIGLFVFAGLQIKSIFPKDFGDKSNPSKNSFFGIYSPWLPGKKTSPIVSTGAQYHAPTSREGTAMKLGPGPKGV